MAKCAKCKKEITGTVVNALDKKWHETCFRCNECAGELKGGSFFKAKNDRILCDSCFKKTEAPRCGKCDEPVVGAVISAVDKKWHPSCFVCTHCREPFGSDGFVLNDGKPYCKKDAEILFGAKVSDKKAGKCKGCKKQIDGRFLEALDSHWHPGCFVCSECHDPISGSSFKTRKDKPICPKH